MKDMKKDSLKRKFLAVTLGSLIVVNVLSICNVSVVKLGKSSANLNASNVTENIEDVNKETEEMLKLTLANAFTNFETSVNVSDYNVTTDVLAKLVAEVTDEHSEFFYIGTDYNMSYSGSKFMTTGLKVATKLNLQYTEGVDVIKEKIDYINQVADEIVAGVNDNMSDLEKALYVHDYLALNYEYDTRVYDEAEASNAIYDMYNFFEQKKGVCQAYTEVYKFIMEYKLGVPTESVTCPGHTWNVINIDGSWYHVDVTWDDPIPNRIGSLQHKNFLLSDKAIAAENHPEWTYIRGHERVCSDEKYDNFWWRDVSTEIYNMNGELLSISDDGKFVAHDKSGDVVSASVASFDIERDTWYAWNSDDVFWTNNYTTLIKSGNVFFYNTTENVYVINLDGSNKRLVASYPKSEHNGFQIYGMGIDGDTLYVILQNNPQDVGDTKVQKERIDVADINDIDDIATPVDSPSHHTMEVINWTEVSQSLQENKSVEVSFSEEEAPSLPAEVVEEAKGKDVNLIINVGSYQWNVNGLDISDNSVADVDLGVKENEGIIPADVTKNYVDDQKTVEVNLDHEGQFGYKASLRVQVGSEYAGQTASVLHYDESKARLAYQESTTVNDEGYVYIDLSHASSYMIVIDSKPVGLPGDINGDGTTVLNDLVQFKQYLINKKGSSGLKLVNVDMDGDNVITIRDAVLLAREMVK